MPRSCVVLKVYAVKLSGFYDYVTVWMHRVSSSPQDLGSVQRSDGGITFNADNHVRFPFLRTFCFIVPPSPKEKEATTELPINHLLSY